MNQPVFYQENQIAQTLRGCKIFHSVVSLNRPGLFGKRDNTGKRKTLVQTIIQFNNLRLGVAASGIIV